jgi:hypothetical protein
MPAPLPVPVLRAFSSAGLEWAQSGPGAGGGRTEGGKPRECYVQSLLAFVCDMNGGPDPAGDDRFRLPALGGPGVLAGEHDARAEVPTSLRAGVVVARPGEAGPDHQAGHRPGHRAWHRPGHRAGHSFRRSVPPAPWITLIMGGGPRFTPKVRLSGVFCLFRLAVGVKCGRVGPV